MKTPLPPGSRVGILGGGQLGRMLALVARRMGYRTVVFAPDPEGPAGQVADQEFLAGYDDVPAARRFASLVDAATFEFENIPAATTAAVAELVPVHPAGAVLHTTQNRLREKEAVRAAGVPTVRFARVDGEAALARAVEEIGTPAVLKTAAWGYDGRGQVRLDDAGEALAAWGQIDRAEAVLEAFAPFERELSVVGARGADGSMAVYEPFENDHANHILDLTVSPAVADEALRQRAQEICRTLLEQWEVVGVICVELFQMPGGELLVNEIAPRPHNSGHLTIDAHECSQFEQQLRAVCGLPLGSTALRAPAAAMANLLGDLWEHGEPDWAAATAVPGVALHLYGKADARPGRKMGHLTATAATVQEARAKVLEARERLRSVPGGQAKG